MSAPEMVYATELIMRYRQALSYLWNMHFFGPEEFRSYDYLAAEQFLRCQLPLFNTLVLDRLGSDFEDATAVFGDEFKIVPWLNVPGSMLTDVMVNRQLTGSQVFERVNGQFKGDDLKLSIIDFYDFQVRSWREFHYYLARVEHFRSNPSLVGCEALLEVGSVDVIWMPKRVLGLSVNRLKEKLSE